MKRLLLMALMLVGVNGLVFGQIYIGEDYASNYGATWAGNGGYGFGNWSFNNPGSNAGQFFSSSTPSHGDINSSDGRSFGMQGTTGYAESERQIATWGDQATFTIQLAVKFRDGQRGISLFNTNGFTAGDEIWNFNINDTGYGTTGWAYSADMVITVTAMQDGNDVKINLSANGSGGPYTSPSETTISNQTLGGFRLYIGDTGGTVDRNFYINNLGITVPSLADVPNDAVVRLASNQTLSSDITVSSFTISSGVTFTASDASPRTLTITKSTAGTATTLTNNGTWANGSGGSTVVFTGAPNGPTEGTDNSVHATSGTIAFNNVTVNKTGGARDVGMDFTTNSSVNGTLQIGQGGYIATAPPSGFYNTNAILEFNQGGAAPTYNVNTGDNSWSTTEIPNSITITTGTVSLNEARTLTNTLLIGVDGTLVTNGNLTISAGGRVDNSGTITGSIAYGVTITGSEGWRMMSSPVAGNYSDLLDPIWTQGITTGGDTDAGDSSVRTFDTATDAFETVSNLNTSMTAGNGFIVYVYSDDDYTTSGADAGFPKNLSITGTENSGTVTPTLNDGEAGNGRFTLVGNPYMSAIDFDLIGKTEVVDVVYVYDHNYSSTGSPNQTNATGGGFRAWNVNTGDLTDGIIAPFQGFYVYNTTNDVAHSISIEEADKVTDAGTFYKEASPAPVIKLRGVMNGELASNAYMSFDESGKVGIDSRDAYKLFPLDEIAFLALGTEAEDYMLDINNLPVDLEEAIEVPLMIRGWDFQNGAWISTGGDVELTWPELSNIPADWVVQLVDTQTEQVIDLTSETSYSVTIEAITGKMAKKSNDLLPTPQLAEAEASRLKLVIGPITTSNEDIQVLPTEITLRQNFPNPFNPSTQIGYILPEATEVRLSIFDMLGREVDVLVSGSMSAGAHNAVWNASNAASGVYYYRLQAGTTVLTRKMTLVK